jgi:hypothetical protein
MVHSRPLLIGSSLRGNRRYSGLTRHLFSQGLSVLGPMHLALKDPEVAKSLTLVNLVVESATVSYGEVYDMVLGVSSCISSLHH